MKTSIHKKSLAVICALIGIMAGLTGCKGESQNTGPQPGGGGSDSFAACSTPASLSAAYLALGSVRPCWNWLDTQAASIASGGRIALPATWKAIGFDPSSVAPPGTDSTSALKAKGDSVVSAFIGEINISPYPMISAPWANSSGVSYEFPYSATVLDEKLRGLATIALYARSLGYPVKFQLALDNNWVSTHQFTSQAEFISWVDNVYAPQIATVAQAAERIHAEIMTHGISVEVEQFFYGQTALKALGSAALQTMADYWLTKAALAIGTTGGFTGKLMARLVSNEAHYTMMDWGNWTATSLANYDEIGITVTGVTPGCTGYADVLDAAVNRVNVMIGKAATTAKPWSLAEFLAPYSGSTLCSEANENEIYNLLVDRLNGGTAAPHNIFFSRAPVGIGFDLSPVPLPAQEIRSSTQTIIKGLY